MSCNICHAPILVSKRYLYPSDERMLTQEDHLLPIVKEVCPPNHQSYFRDMVLLDRRLEGIVGENVVHSGRGVFISSHWAILGGAANAIRQEEINWQGVTMSSYNLAHVGCLKMFCGKLGIPYDLGNLDTLVALLERFEYLGTTVCGGYDGIDYSEGRMEERWLTQPFGEAPGNKFQWEFQDGAEDWTMKRPDMLPRLYPIGGKPGRLDGLDSRTRNSTIFLRSGPHEHIFSSIIKYLELSDLYNLAVICKELRYYCLTDSGYQIAVRGALQQTQWALPVAPEISDKLQDGYPDSSISGDWLLYGTHIHKTNSMRNRSRIFKIIVQMETQYRANATKEGYLNGPNSTQMQNYLRASIEQQLLIHKLNEMYDYELFIKCMNILNGAYREDLNCSKFTGSQIPVAVESVKREMRGKKMLVRRPLGRWLKGLDGAVRERMSLFMIEKNKNAQMRVFTPKLTSDDESDVSEESEASQESQESLD